MGRLVRGCVCLVLLSGVLGMGVVSADEESLCIPVGNLTIQAPDTVEARRSPVEFPHSAHFVYNCQECHHMWEGDANLSGCMAGGCHDLDMAPERTAAGKLDPEEAVMYYKNAFHDKCIGCHKQIQLGNKRLVDAGQASSQLPATGPTGCVGCHPKE